MPFELVRTDIVRMETDAIVNAANSSLYPGGGVCGAIFSAAGYEQLNQACRSIGHCDVGSAVLTSGFGLPAKYVIHAVGPIWQGGSQSEAALLGSAYRSALNLAAEHQLQSIAFPLISAGIYGYPKQEAFRIAVNTIQDFLLDHELTVYLVIFERSSVVVGQRLFANIQSYIDDHYVEQRSARSRETELLQQHRQLSEQRSAAPSPTPEPKFPLLRRFFGSRRDAGSPPEDSAPYSASSAPDSASSAPLPDHCFGSASRLSEPEDTYYDSGSLPPLAPGPSHRSLEDLVKNLDESFSQMLLRLIDEKGLTDVEVYKRANLDRKLFSKLRRSSYRPGKQTAVALAIALRLNLDETADLLGRAGYALSPSSRSDVIVRYFIEEGIYDIFTVNEALFSFGEKLLGA